MELTTPVSRLISDLEKRLNAKLLQRTTRQRALTDIGADYAERCREVLALVDEAEAQATSTASSPQGRLRVQSMASFGHHYVSPVMAEFCADQPQLTVEYSTSQYVPDLLARGVDVSLYLAESLGDSALVARRLGTTFSILCASPAYLQRHGEPQEPAQLLDHACLRLVNPSITPDWNLVGKNGATDQVCVQGQLIADTPELLRGVVMRDAGITLLPLFSVIDAVRSDNYCACFLTGARQISGYRTPPIAPFHGCQNTRMAGLGGSEDRSADQCGCGVLFLEGKFEWGAFRRCQKASSAPPGRDGLCKRHLEIINLVLSHFLENLTVNNGDSTILHLYGAVAAISLRMRFTTFRRVPSMAVVSSWESLLLPIQFLLTCKGLTNPS